MKLSGLSRPKAAAFLEWAHEHAVPIDRLENGDADVEQLSSLDKWLENKRVVYLGEEDHWIHEKSDYRLLLLHYLISRGWRYIGEELGLSDGIRINRYLESGDEAELERIATYGYQGGQRSDRVDKATGILKDSSENYPVESFKGEQLRLIRALRAINSGGKLNSAGIHYFGFDINAVAGGGYEDIKELLCPFQDEPAAGQVWRLLNRIDGETLEEEIARVEKALERIKVGKTDLMNVLGEKRYLDLQEWTLTLCDSLRFNRIANPATNYKTLNIAMAQREEVMCRHVETLLGRMGPAGKLVLMGHNRHLSKNIGAIKNAGAAPPGGKRVPSIGTYINRLLPGQVFSIWQLCGGGSSSQPYSWLESKYFPKPGSLNEILAQVGANYILPTAGAKLLEKKMDIVGIYNMAYRAAIAEQADAIFFIGEVSPLRP